MKISDVAKQLNMPCSTIRYYEKRGLLPPPARVSGKREFDKNALLILRFIQLCQSAGFSIGEILELLEQYTEDSSKQGRCQPAVVAKRKDVRAQIEELEKMDAVLAELTKCRCRSIEQCVTFALESAELAELEGTMSFMP